MRSPCLAFWSCGSDETWPTATLGTVAGLGCVYGNPTAGAAMQGDTACGLGSVGDGRPLLGASASQDRGQGPEGAGLGSEQGHGRERDRAKSLEGRVESDGLDVLDEWGEAESGLVRGDDAGDQGAMVGRASDDEEVCWDRVVDASASVSVSASATATGSGTGSGSGADAGAWLEQQQDQETGSARQQQQARWSVVK